MLRGWIRQIWTFDESIRDSAAIGADMIGNDGGERRRGIGQKEGGYKQKCFFNMMSFLWQKFI
jgi:hypothetical protein